MLTFLPVHPGHALHVAHQLVGDGVVGGRDGVDVHLWAPQLHFLRQGFGGATNFEAPLARAMQIIEQHPAYEKADVLMISDGDCQLSDHFCQHLHQRKAVLDCMVYSVLCDGQRVADGFSDEVAVL